MEVQEKIYCNQLFNEFEELQDELDYMDSRMAVPFEDNSMYVIENRMCLIEDIRAVAEILIDAGYEIEFRNSDCLLVL